MPPFASPDSLSVRTFASAAKFEQWLERECERTDGVWIAIAKKAADVPSVTYDEAVEAALCFGWIDGQRRAHDDVYFLQRFTPRRARSPWSKVNRGKAEALIAAGRVRPSGQAAIDSAKEDGRWDAAYAALELDKEDALS